ncbi:DUF4358 domain-containing protein [Sinanaerobacter sp. ZZT-01]|uniref:DUF4358 domain-containing protein n=1 Tax=Sinanaerobacter sp. ZZT-01 TaxID=3111540 RepID=UPI002D7A02E7|nr:DUF4358 domain-containing protein [Sinanaerobacter sp. ZZT-01]WRR94142.1 DUF4358 domain-containing protein [Sinanaerobacter sp. ZZT-01]
MTKRVWKISGILLLIAAGLCACGEKSEVALNINEVAEALQSGITFEDQMNQVELPIFYALYNLSEEEVDDAVMIGSTGATAEEIAVIKAKSEDMVDKVKEAVSERVEFQKEGFENYVPKELEKLSDPIIVTKGNYVILCVSEDNTKAQEIIDEYITE